MPTIDLPIPPSVNDLLRPVIRRRKCGRLYPRMLRSPEYQSWLEAAVLLLRVGMRPAMRFPIRLSIEIIGGSGFPVTRDLDNTIKAIQDAMVHAERLPNDDVRHVSSLAAIYSPGDGAALCRVSIEEPEPKEQGN
jgi:Holliday junction resolvase RusA-like endonuclease